MTALAAVPSHAFGKAAPKAQVKVVTIRYRAHNGAARRAYVVLPSWYSAENDPPIPLIISPHGRGVSAMANARLWGALPARGSFAVISPDGEGRKLKLYSWGSPGQIDDLAKMPAILAQTRRWVHVDRRRIYAFGGSMGGQETLLLLARHPGLLAGAAAFDAVTDLALQYQDFPQLGCKGGCAKTLRHQSFGRRLQEMARTEIGGTPSSRPGAFAERSPLTYAASIARSCVPLQLWWSMKDKIVLDQSQQTGALYSRLDQLNPDAPVTAFIGTWRHSAEMRATTRLPAALAAFGLLPPVAHPKTGLHEIVPPDPSGCAVAP